MLRRKNISQIKKIGKLFRMLGQPARIRILMAIGNGEACVCHLEAALGYRQAYISQHLMTLRKLRLVKSRRDGRNIFYRLSNLEVLDLLQDAADLADLGGGKLQVAEDGEKVTGCDCPHCEPEWIDVPLVNMKQGTASSA